MHPQLFGALGVAEVELAALRGFDVLHLKYKIRALPLSPCISIGQFTRFFFKKIVNLCNFIVACVIPIVVSQFFAGSAFVWALVAG